MIMMMGVLFHSCVINYIIIIITIIIIIIIHIYTPVEIAV